MGACTAMRITTRRLLPGASQNITPSPLLIGEIGIDDRITEREVRSCKDTRVAVGRIIGVLFYDAKSLRRERDVGILPANTRPET